jgi:altronate dehydratase small subunit
VKGEVHDGAALVMAADDTVATALADLPAGRTFEVDGQRIELVEAVEFGHKFALVAHEAGDPVRKYGEVVGRASTAIRAGEHAHTHNCESARGRGDLSGRDGRDGDGQYDRDADAAEAGASAGTGAGAVDGSSGGDRR